MSYLNIVVMAAGRGTRMKSQKPKVLHTLGGIPMLQRVINTVEQLHPQLIAVVTGFGSEQVKAAIQRTNPDTNLHFVLQEPQLGTGHAVQQAAPLLPEKDNQDHDAEDGNSITVILNGDGPLIEAATVRALIKASAGKSLALLTIELDNPTGYGRIVRTEHGQIQGIVEEKDATAGQRLIRETNTGVMAVPTRHLKKWLSQLTNDNAQQEYYLTDIVAMAVADKVDIVGVRTTDAIQVAGVNSPAQLAALERAYQQRIAAQLLEQGVRLSDPARLDVRGALQCGQDVEIDVNCIFEGQVAIGNNVRIGAHCFISNATIADGAVIHPFTHIEGQKGNNVQVGANALVGPYARLRPGAVLAENVHIGNFVEIKNATLAQGAKANHLTYLGDATVGEKTNIGAGTITANYDGVNKHKTTIGSQVRVGSNSVLVAPVEIGNRGTIGAGSVITRNTPENALTLTRAQQVSKPDWKRPEKPT